MIDNENSKKSVVKFSHDMVRIDGEYSYAEDLFQIADQIIQNQCTINDCSVDSGAPDYKWEFDLDRMVVVSIHEDCEDIPINLASETEVESVEYRGYLVPATTFQYSLELIKFERVDGVPYAFYDFEVKY